jgi:RHS repeat-associated protein
VITHKKQRNGNVMKRLLRWMALGLLLAGTHALAQSTGTVTYVYTDPQGTPLAEADANGNITATFEYTPYGTYAPQGTAAPGPDPTGPGYTGHVNDPETNLVYMQARYYDPAIGRFLSVDPVKSAETNLTTFNRYDYADDNPIINTDPTGGCVGSRNGNGQDSPCNPAPSSQDRPRAPAPSVSYEVQKMRDASDRSNGIIRQSMPMLSTSGLLVGKPSVAATGIAAYGGGVEVVKGIYKAEDELNLITPASGLSASVDVKLFELPYKGTNAPEGPINFSAGGELSFHEIVGGRVSIGYTPPSTFRIEIDGGAGEGAAYHLFSVGTTVNSN